MKMSKGFYDLWALRLIFISLLLSIIPIIVLMTVTGELLDFIPWEESQTVIAFYSFALSLVTFIFSAIFKFFGEKLFQKWFRWTLWALLTLFILIIDSFPVWL